LYGSGFEVGIKIHHEHGRCKNKYTSHRTNRLHERFLGEDLAFAKVGGHLLTLLSLSSVLKIATMSCGYLPRGMM